ncbi:hypothetical protein KKA33_04170 [Patescibacteria group bacterium]|nr:hypothetical protein [Patescibacteria group bacterium]
MSFLTIIILGVVNLQSSNLVMMNRQNHEIQAHFYANQGLKIAEALGYNTLNTNCPADDPGDPNAIRNCKLQKVGDYSVIHVDVDGEGVVQEPEEIDELYYRSFTLDPAGLTDKGFKTEMKVAWTDGTGEHEVSAKRIIYQ